jgi:dihydrodipicolinate synthase/N-acetylneuraminate lyase
MRYRGDQHVSTLPQVQWRGYFAATPTPFTETGELDLDAFGKLLQYFQDEGAHGIVVNGSSGEWYAQDVDERRAVARAAVEQIGGSVPTIVGVSAIQASDTVALIRHAQSIGADGVMYSPPPGWRLTRDEIRSYFAETCAVTDLPVMLYNIPADVASDLDPELIADLAGIPNVVAVKDSTRDDLQFMETVRRTRDRIAVFGNVLTRPGLAMVLSGWGGAGYIGGGMLFGRELATAFEDAWAGRTEEALAVVDRLVDLQEDLNLHDGNGRFGGIPGQLKATLNLLGQPAGHPRFPRAAVAPELLEGLRATLRRHGMEVAP